MTISSTKKSLLLTASIFSVISLTSCSSDTDSTKITTNIATNTHTSNITPSTTHTTNSQVNSSSSTSKKSITPSSTSNMSTHTINSSHNPVVPSSNKTSSTSSNSTSSKIDNNSAKNTGNFFQNTNNIATASSGMLTRSHTNDSVSADDLPVGTYAVDLNCLGGNVSINAKNSSNRVTEANSKNISCNGKSLNNILQICQPNSGKITVNTILPKNDKDTSLIWQLRQINNHSCK